MTNGFGGAGAYSDGKFNITTEFGGWLSDALDDDELLDLIKYVDSINLEYGATKTITNPYTDSVREIEKQAIAVGLKLLRANVRHIGTEENLKILAKIYEDLNKHIDMAFRSPITDVIVEDGKCIGVETKDNKYYGEKIFLAVVVMVRLS